MHAVILTATADLVELDSCICGVILLEADVGGDLLALRELASDGVLELVGESGHFGKC